MIYTTTSEFNKLLLNKNIVAMVANMLASKAFVPITLVNSNKFTIHHYMEKAKKLINDLEEYNLEIHNKE